MYSCIVSHWNWWDYSSSYLCSQLNFLWLPPQGPIQEVCWSGAWTSQADSFQINSIEQKFYYNLLTEVWATYPVRKTHFSLLYELYQPFHGTKTWSIVFHGQVWFTVLLIQRFDNWSSCMLSSLVLASPNSLNNIISQKNNIQGFTLTFNLTG